jgi:hypothetical protein
VFWKIFWDVLFSETKAPSPRRFPEKVLLSGKDFEGSPNGRVPKCFNSPPPPPPLPTRYCSGRPWVFPFICNDYILKYFNVKRNVQQCRNSNKNFGQKKLMYYNMTNWTIEHFWLYMWYTCGSCGHFRISCLWCYCIHTRVAEKFAWPRWSWESNLRPLAYSSNVLPTELRGQVGSSWWYFGIESSSFDISVF